MKLELSLSRRRTFPYTKSFLTEEEYHEQGVRETIKALENLRQYCSSSECNQWKTILSLQKPLRYKKQRCEEFLFQALFEFLLL